MTVDDVKRTRPDVPIVIVGGSGGPVTGKIAGEVPAYVGDPPSSSTVAEVVTLAGIYHLEWDSIAKALNTGEAIKCLQDYTY